MTKLLFLTACLLAVATISAMPVLDVERKDAVPALSVVPLEKSAEKALELPVEAIKTEPVVSSEPVLVPEESPKKGEETLPKSLDAKKPETLEKLEEKKPELEAQKAEEEKKIEEPKAAEPKAAVERKADEELKVAPSEKYEQVNYQKLRTNYVASFLFSEILSV
jgi:hypothetical protein